MRAPRILCPSDVFCNGGAIATGVLPLTFSVIPRTCERRIRGGMVANVVAQGGNRVDDKIVNVG